MYSYFFFKCIIFFKMYSYYHPSMARFLHTVHQIVKSKFKLLHSIFNVHSLNIFSLVTYLSQSMYLKRI